MKRELSEKDEQITQRIQQAIRKVIDEQIETDNPPETEEVLFRLIEEDGFSEAEAFELISRVVSEYFIGALTEGQPFDIEDYINALTKLPKPYADGPDVSQ